MVLHTSAPYTSYSSLADYTFIPLLQSSEYIDLILVILLDNVVVRPRQGGLERRMFQKTRQLYHPTNCVF